MKLQHLIFGIMATVILYSCGEKKENTVSETPKDTTSTEQVYAVNTDSSVVTWKGEMLKVKSHNGTVKLKGGELMMKGSNVSGGIFTVDLATINPTDNGYGKDNPKEKLIGHLTSPDFFATDSFPTATFVIKKAEGNTITGDLTIRGKTNEEKVTDAVIEKTATGVKATGKLVFDRNKYGVSFKMPVQDMVLSDNIEVGISLVAQP